LGDSKKGKNFPRVKFDFEPLTPKDPSGPPKWLKATGEKFEFGSLSKSTNSPE
jgi:hypothetical protein